MQITHHAQPVTNNLNNLRMVCCGHPSGSAPERGTAVVCWASFSLASVALASVWIYISPCSCEKAGLGGSGANRKCAFHQAEREP